MTEPFGVCFSVCPVVLLRLWPWVSKIIILGALCHLFLAPDVFVVLLQIGS